MQEEHRTARNTEQDREVSDMTAITLLLGLGICVFLFWFFGNLFRDSYEEDEYEPEYVIYEPVYGEPGQARRQ